MSEQARQDLREKLKLERRLAEQIRAFNKRLVINTTKEYGATGAAFNAETMQPELIKLLDDHYKDVGGKFDHQLTDELPDDVAATPEERAAIAAALAAFFSARASDQAEIITGTNHTDIDGSISQAVMLSQEESQAGRPQSRLDIAVLAGAALSRKLAGRVTSVAATETQAPAEAAKATEAQVLTGQPPSVTGGTMRPVDVNKEWITVGDERVREAHIMADSQVQTLNQSFEVGGEQLRWPGDTSLGASPGNVINCRCSSVVDRDNVLAERRKRDEEPSIDRTASEQLVTSMGEG